MSNDHVLSDAAMNAMPKSLSSSMMTWLRAFEAVARLGHFTRASEELHITQSATSQQIQQLEQAVGFRLIERGGRPLGLTAEGERLSTAVAASFSQIRQALADIANPGGTVPITLSCSPSFAMQWLVHRLGDLRRDHPQVDIRVFAEFHQLDKARMANDHLVAAIRYDRGEYHDVSSECFLDEYLIPVASPSFMAARPTLTSPRQLRGEWLLHDARPWPQAPELQEWQSWLDTADGYCTDLQVGKRFNLATLAVGAAVAGEGIAMARTATVVDELRAGTLIVPFPVASRSVASYHFITTPERSVQVEMMGDWLQKEGESFSAARNALFAERGIELR